MHEDSQELSQAPTPLLGNPKNIIWDPAGACETQAGIVPRPTAWTTSRFLFPLSKEGICFFFLNVNKYPAWD